MFSGRVYLKWVVLVLESCTCLLWMIVLWIVKSLKGCLNSLLAKVIKLINLITLLCFLFVFGSFGLDSNGFWIFFFFAVTVVESGTRALQYLGLDGDTSSIGFDVSKVSKLGLEIFLFYFFWGIFSFCVWCLCCCFDEYGYRVWRLIW